MGEGYYDRRYVERVLLQDLRWGKQEAGSRELGGVYILIIN